MGTRNVTICGHYITDYLTVGPDQFNSIMAASMLPREDPGYKKPEFQLDYSETQLKTFGEVWVLNDWYIQPWMRPLRHPNMIFNPLTQDIDLEKAKKCANRYTPNWKHVYNEVGCPVVTFEYIDGLMYQIKFPIDECIRRWGKKLMTSTVSYMLLWIMLNPVPYRKVVLKGIRFNRQTGPLQIPAVNFCVKELRRMGIEVDAPWEKEWDEMAWHLYEPEKIYAH